MSITILETDFDRSILCKEGEWDIAQGTTASSSGREHYTRTHTSQKKPPYDTNMLIAE